MCVYITHFRMIYERTLGKKDKVAHRHNDFIQLDVCDADKKGAYIRYV